MALFEGLIIAVEEFVNVWGLLGAFLIAVSESFIFPVPTAVFIAPMTAFGIDPLVITVVATIGSVIGAVIGYFLGKHLGHPIAVRLFKERRVAKVEVWFKKWGAWAVFLAAFTPIPFKVFTWCGGIFEMRLKPFILAAIAGRFLQFFIAAYVGSLLGPTFLVWFGGI
jgi:membrane protein YqaA with SNARE-associated domain